MCIPLATASFVDMLASLVDVGFGVGAMFVGCVGIGRGFAAVDQEEPPRACVFLVGEPCLAQGVP